MCTDLSGKEPLRHVGVDRVVTSGMVYIMARNASDVGSMAALGAMLPIFITALPMTPVVMIWILYKLCIALLSTLPFLCI